MKRTVLYDKHVGAGANMAAFGGYEMPLWYKTGVKAEHMAVIGSVGIFDTSHMAAVSVRGEGAFELLQRCFSKDLEHALGSRPLMPGRCVYGVILKPSGFVLDDAIVYMLAENSYLIVVNAGMGGAVAAHFQEQGGDVRIEDHTDNLGKMDIQGPNAGRVLQKLLSQPEATLAGLGYFSFRGAIGAEGQSHIVTKDGIPLLVSRTGYTGEFGFELFCEVKKLPQLWDAVLAAGEDFGLICCGLAARDSLRAGAVLPLSHQDIGDWPFRNNPWPFALPWNGDGTGFTKDFIGASALLAAGKAKHTLPFCGFDPRKIPVTEKSRVLDEAGNEIGRILTCTTDMAIDRVDGELVSSGLIPELQPRGLSCGFILVGEVLPPGTKVVLTDGKRKIPVEIRSDVRPGRTARASIAAML